MHRQPVIRSLEAYRQTWASGQCRHASFSHIEETTMVERFSEFLREHSACFGRADLPGHFTGSALITNKTKDRVLLTLHGKLNIWLQLGGHAEGDHLVYRVAMREAEEESGLSKLSFVENRDLFLEVDLEDPLPFDFDCHRIPARKDEPEHYHFDVRYLIEADDQEAIQISDESHDLRWFSLEEARTVTSERSMLRQFDKLDMVREMSMTPRDALKRAPESADSPRPRD